MADPRAPTPVTVEGLSAFCVRALRAAGLAEDDAAAAADVLVTTDAWGVFTHGTKSLRGYVRRLRAGGLRADATPAVAAEGPAWAVVDGGSGLAMLTSVYAMRLAMSKAAAAGIGYVAVRNSSHFGAAGYYASLAAAGGMIGLAMANDIPSVAAPGSRGAVTGSNPLAYAIPAGREKPILLDMATSTVAGGKVYAARAAGAPIPPGWIVGADGMPSTDGSQFPLSGALTPMAGHKGYGLALLIESLSALVSGAAMTWQVRAWMLDDPSLATGHGAAFVALDVEAMTPGGQFRRRVDELIAEVRNSPRAEGSDRIWLPGEMEWERRERALREGIPLPPDVVESLRGLADDLQLDADELFAGLCVPRPERPD
jgi:LDH2 family malate/lactate/ureidoglycolate dehydrogenase